MPLVALAAVSCADDERIDDDGDGNSAPTQAELVARGDYLVNHVAACVDCHTPRNADGSFDLDNFMAGSDCLFDINPAMDGVGCLATPNLTNHETGLMNRSDQEIKDMFLGGERPNDEYLSPVMPYWLFGNMTDEDADAIVAYLRTIEGVDHETADSEAPFDMRPPAPANRLDLALVPSPDASDPNYESATRGRYLAAQIGACIECHTQENPPGSPDPLNMDMLFAGGREFPIAPGLTPTSKNLTPDPTTGLQDYTADLIVRVLHEGIDKNDEPLCPPMPVGPMGPFGGLTDQDAEDIANYILSLPPIENEVEDCSLMMPPPGGGGAGGAPASGGGAGGSGGA